MAHCCVVLSVLNKEKPFVADNAGKSRDEAYIFVTEGSSLKQAAYLIQFFFCAHVLQLI